MKLRLLSRMIWIFSSRFLLRLRNSRCSDSTPEFSGQVAGCRAVFTNFLRSFLGWGVLRDHIALVLSDYYAPVYFC